MNVNDKVVIVTGASSGVGAAVAVKLAQLGAKIVINYARSQAGAQQTRIFHLGAAEGDNPLGIEESVQKQAPGRDNILITNGPDGSRGAGAGEKMNVRTRQSRGMGAGEFGQFYIGRTARGQPGIGRGADKHFAGG